MIKLTGRELIFESFPNGETKVDGKLVREESLSEIRERLLSQLPA